MTEDDCTKWMVFVAKLTFYLVVLFMLIIIIFYFFGPIFLSCCGTLQRGKISMYLSLRVTMIQATYLFSLIFESCLAA